MVSLMGVFVNVNASEDQEMITSNQVLENGFNSWVMEPNVNTVKRAVEVMKKVENGEDVKALAQQVMEENTADE